MWSLQRRLVATNYGREAGWIAELDGVPIAVLTEPVWEDMFWFSYRWEPLVADPAMIARMQTPDFWNTEVISKVVWRNREFDRIAMGAWTSGLMQDGRLVMRGLHLTDAWLWPIEDVERWFRRCGSS
jgi:hypothetical protein